MSIGGVKTGDFNTILCTRERVIRYMKIKKNISDKKLYCSVIYLKAHKAELYVSLTLQNFFEKPKLELP